MGLELEFKYALTGPGQLEELLQELEKAFGPWEAVEMETVMDPHQPISHFQHSRMRILAATQQKNLRRRFSLRRRVCVIWIWSAES